MTMPRRHAVAFLIVLLVSTGQAFASEHYGQVTFAGLPVPGATVTASQGDKQFVTITNQQGVYRLADLADGVWTVRVEMLAFATASQDITIAAGAQPSLWELKLVPFEEIAKIAAPSAANPANRLPQGSGGQEAGSQ
jgi:carboxypeptidase family protein